MSGDKDLQRDVIDELDWEPRVNAAHIAVAAKDGVVTLTGHVPSCTEKFLAEQAAKRVYGVRAVADELEVQLPGANKHTDEEIAHACLSVLRSRCSVPDEKLMLVVTNSWVTLEGEVDWQYQREAAEDAVRSLTGLMGVINNLKVKTHVSTGDVKNKIEAAFKRNAEIDARRVGVEALNGKVVLHGSVRSWAERDEAQHSAWSAPGVNAVDNQIVVTP